MPCSGEGMFRKTPEAVSEWSPASPASCAERQRAILSAALPCLKAGGVLIYSTCTYSPEENEETVSWLLREYPALTLVPVDYPTMLAYTDPGLARDGVPAGATRRHYPHSGGGIFGGEGQFFALFRLSTPIGGSPRKQKKGGGEPKRQPVDKGTENLIYANGVTVGEIRSGRLVPHHAFFSAFGTEFQRKLDFPSDDPRLAAYLHGDVIPAPDLSDGWGAVLCEGVPVGGVHITGAVAKNHYPKGLRRN